MIKIEVILLKMYQKAIISLVLVLSLMVTMLLTNTTDAAEGEIHIKRDEVGQMALDNSRVVADLETTRNSLITQFSDMNAMTSGLKILHDQLPAYQGLYTWYQAMAAIPNYHTYLGLAANPATAAQAALMIDEVDNGDLTVGEETALKAAVANPANMQVADYLGYAALQPQYAAMGITDPNIDKETEYDTFVYPIEIAPFALQNGVTSISRNITLAEKGIASGGRAIYDAILQLEGILAITKTSYDSARNDFSSAEKRYASGMVSEISYETSKNKQAIAHMNHRSMIRQVNNLKMNLNVMLGQDVMAKISLTQPTSEDIELIDLLPIETYIERALEERNELITNYENYNLKKLEFDKIDDYFSSSSNKYKATELELKDLEYEKESLLMSIEQEIRNAYVDIAQKREDLELKGLKLEDAKRQYSELELNVELGYVTEAMLTNIDMLVISSENDYNAALIAYGNALSSFDDATRLGPAYAGTQGGMGFE